MRFNVLGPLEIVVGETRVPLTGLNRRATLAFLLLHANKMVPTSQLLRALWDDNPPSTARKMLHNAVSHLRGVLSSGGAGADAPSIITDAGGYLLNVDPKSIDLVRFHELAERGRRELEVGAWATAGRALREALDLWRGPVLADLVEHGIAWPELTVLRNTRLALLEDYVEAQLATGRQHEVVPLLERAVAETDPPRECLTAQLMLALYRCGRQAEALDVYRRARASLVDKLGIEPGRTMQNLERAILDHDPKLTLGAEKHGPYGPGHPRRSVLVTAHRRCQTGALA
jgi:DNA-binding SARP family transcriptional activator